VSLGQLPQVGSERSGWRGADTERRALLAARREQEWRARASARAARDAGLPSLDEVTHNTQAFVPGPAIPGDCRFEAKITHYHDGRRVVVQQRRPPRVECTRKRNPSCSDQERFDSSVARSRTTLRHKTRCLGADHMWTFTRRGKFECRDHLWAAWATFCRFADKRRLRSTTGEPWQYCAVPELHQDGETWHLHVAVRGLFEVTTIRFLWERALGGAGLERGRDTHGNVDAKFFRGRQGGRRIWAYLAAYVGKGIAASTPGRKCFATSKDIAPARVDRYHEVLGSDGSEFERAFQSCHRIAEQLGLGQVWPRARCFGDAWVAWFEVRA